MIFQRAYQIIQIRQGFGTLERDPVDQLAVEVAPSVIKLKVKALVSSRRDCGFVEKVDPIFFSGFKHWAHVRSKHRSATLHGFWVLKKNPIHCGYIDE